MTLLSANQNAYIFRANDNALYKTLKLLTCMELLYYEIELSFIMGWV